MSDQLGYISPEDRELERLDDTWRGPYAGFIPDVTVVPIDSAPSATTRKKSKSSSTPETAPVGNEVRIAGANDPKPDWRHDEQTIDLGFKGVETVRAVITSPTHKDEVEADVTDINSIDPRDKAVADIGVALVRAVSAQKRRTRMRKPPTPTPSEVVSETKTPPLPPRPRRS